MEEDARVLKGPSFLGSFLLRRSKAEHMSEVSGFNWPGIGMFLRPWHGYDRCG
jgi:hypothetical protein